jgi:hypothetical protein
MEFETTKFIRLCRSKSGHYLIHTFLKPKPNLLMPQNVKDRRSAINLPKFFIFGSLKKVLMPKTHQGLAIRDNFITVKMIVVIFLDFSDPDKVHRAPAINDFFMSFVNVCLSHILPMPKGIGYLSNLYVNNLCKEKPPSIDVDKDWRSMTVVFVWFLYLLELFSTLNLSVLGAVFSCRFLIQVLRSFSHEISQVQTKMTR